MVNDNKITFKSKDGIKITAVWHLPQNKTDKAIILAHGITVDKDEDGLFIDLGNRLESLGFNVLRFDFRGHGESDGKSVEMTIKGELSDLDSAVDYILEKGYRNIGLLGASFGGGIATLYASKNQEKLKCFCLWNPVLNYDHCFLNPIVKGLKLEEKKNFYLLGSKKIPYGKKLFTEMRDLFPYKELKKITIPTIIIHGDKDSCVPYEDSKTYVKKPKELVTIIGSDHGFHDKPFEGEVIDRTTLFFKKFMPY